MIITPHLIVGAAIGAQIRNFGWIIILALLSHVILDKIPHWDYGKQIEALPRDEKFKTAVFTTLFQMIIDGMVGLITVLFIIWQKNIIEVKHLIFILTGIIVSLLPDFFLGIAKLISHKSKFSKKYIDFHKSIIHYPEHIKKPTLIGLGTEIVVSIIAILILLF